MQLDLFRDSRATILANDVAGALVAHDLRRARTALDELRADEADYFGIDALHALFALLQEWPLPIGDAAAIDTAVARLEQDWPTARAALGDAAADFYAPFWRELAHAPAAQARRAGLLLRAGDYAEAVAAAEALEDGDPDALAWLVIGRYRLGGMEPARAPLLRLALVAPARLRETIGSVDDAPLARDWVAFEAAADWPEPEAEWFPAWWLVEHPVLRAEADRIGRLPASAAARAFSAIAHLLELEAQGTTRALVAARARLREAAPALFAVYMARRSVHHR